MIYVKAEQRWPCPDLDDGYTSDINMASHIVSQAYKDVYNRYVDKFEERPINLMGEVYNGVKAFFEFLDVLTRWPEDETTVAPLY